jgi:hypothetical protein
MNNDTQINSEELDLSELPGYMELVKAQADNTLTTEKIAASVGRLRIEIENELADMKETPQTWLSLLSFFIPFIGMQRKWYQDQHRLYLQARLKNLTFILAIFAGSSQVQAKLEEQMAILKKSQEKYNNERKWMGGGERRG